MKICDILVVSKIKTDFMSNDKIGIINEMIDLFKEDEKVMDLNAVRTAVLEREKIMSTGVGHGFAIPHAKSNGVKLMIAGFGKLSEAIDFESLDGKPVNLIFLLVGPEGAVAPHIKMLSRISRMMNKDSFREALLKAKTPNEIYILFQNEEKNFYDLT